MTIVDLVSLLLGLLLDISLLTTLGIVVLVVGVVLLLIGSTGRAVRRGPQAPVLPATPQPDVRAGSVRGRREDPGKEHLVDRPRTDVLPAGARDPCVPGEPTAPVEGVAAQLGVAGVGVGVVLAEGVSAAAQRGHGRGRGRRTAPEPAGGETDREQPGSHQQADRFHSRLLPVCSSRR